VGRDVFGFPVAFVLCGVSPGISEDPPIIIEENHLDQDKNCHVMMMMMMIGIFLFQVKSSAY
jgi:hypothetical protein